MEKQAGYKKQGASKVPELTLHFWLVKIAATTLGETGGDAVSMSMELGYLLGTVIFSIVFAVAIFFQIHSRRFYPPIYWIAIIATTMVGTTLADFADRSLGIGYGGGTALLVMLLGGSLATWYRVVGSVSIHTVNNSKAEAFYWLTIMFSQTLGTALGDWVADSAGLGYKDSAILFGIILAIIAGLYYRSTLSRTLLFWATFILTRPFGAVVGDFLDKPLDQGGLALSRYSASGALIVFILGCILLFPQRAASNSH